MQKPLESECRAKVQGYTVETTGANCCTAQAAIAANMSPHFTGIVWLMVSDYRRAALCIKLSSWFPVLHLNSSFKSQLFKPHDSPLRQICITLGVRARNITCSQACVLTMLLPRNSSWAYCPDLSNAWPSTPQSRSLKRSDLFALVRAKKRHDKNIQITNGIVKIG